MPGGRRRAARSSRPPSELQIEVLVEEPSAEIALGKIMPKIVDGRARFEIRNLESKFKLLGKLKDRLLAYRDRIDKGENLDILVFVDRDSDDCEELMRKMERLARDAGLRTKTASGGEDFRVVNRIVIEELESWFLGDPDALRAAFPKLPALNPRKDPFRNPDNGGSWETLDRLLRKHGVYGSRYPKIEGAQRIAPHLDPERNRSASFRAFRQGVESLL
ncbi:MAG: DUF4276 family protein [Azospirillaceae bacterium]